MSLTELYPAVRSFSDIFMDTPDLSNYAATVVVTSDTCFQDPNKDLSGQYVVRQLDCMKFSRVNKLIVPDDQEQITQIVLEAIKDTRNILLITVGGTGLCPRDVTPDATSTLYEKNCTGIATALILEGLKHSTHAALSRLTAGIRGQCLIVNFPGKLKASVECFGALSRFLSHALEQVVGDISAVKKTHKKQDEKINGYGFTPEIEIAKSNNENCFIKSLNSCHSVPVRSLNRLTAPISPPPRRHNLKSSDELLVESTFPAMNSLQNSKILQTNSLYALISYEKALEIMGSLAYTVCQTEKVVQLDSLESAQEVVGDIISEDLQSQAVIPPYPVSMMDGYALNIPNASSEKISGSIEAKLVPSLTEFEKLQENAESSTSYFCYQVNTGGRVPEKNFAVIPVENTAIIGSHSISVSKIKLGRYVRPPGSDLDQTDKIPRGTVIGPVELSLLLAMGCKEIKIVKRPTVGVLSTGDELIAFHEKTCSRSDKVIDTNGPLLTALYKKRGYPTISIGIAKDNHRDLLLKIHTGLKEGDILIITGGASMGSKDHVKDVIELIGGILHYGRVNIKPGKPAAMASIMIGGKRKFIFCLPGNPVSAYITSVVLVLPFIEHGIRNHLGYDLPLTTDAIGELITVVISQILDGESYEFDGRLEFVRCKLLSKPMNKPDEPHPVAVSIKQQSSRLLNLKDCDCLILIDPTKKGLRFLVGQTYPALRLRS